MKVNFKEYDKEDKKKKPEIGALCLCQCPDLCQEGIIPAEYTKEGFVFSGHGNIEEYVTGYVTIDYL